jgi:hypothetical protein
VVDDELAALRGDVDGGGGILSSSLRSSRFINERRVRWKVGIARFLAKTSSSAEIIEKHHSTSPHISTRGKYRFLELDPG